MLKTAALLHIFESVSSSTVNFTFQVKKGHGWATYWRASCWTRSF